MSDTGMTVEELEAQRAVLLRQAARIRPLIDGSLAVVHLPHARLSLPARRAA